MSENKKILCKHFGDDPDAPGCCALCGDAREAHCKVCAGTRELVDGEGRWDCYACTGNIIYSRADVEALCAIAVAGVRQQLSAHNAELRVQLAGALLTIEVVRQMATGERAHPDDQDDTDGMNRIAKYCTAWLADKPIPDAEKHNAELRRALADIDKYLSSNLQNSIWPGSKLHQDVKYVLARAALSAGRSGGGE